MKTLLKTGALIPLLAVSSSLAQGTFQNLDFEAANLPPIPSGQYGGFVAISDAFPGWTGNWAVLHNNATLGAPSIDIMGPFWNQDVIISGEFTAVLQAGTTGRPPPDNRVDVWLSQVGLVPPTARSIQVKTGDLQFMFSLAGQAVPLVQIGTGPNYSLYGADISQFAGQVVELKLTAYGTAAIPSTFVSVDDIEFSSVAIPEPGVIALLALGAAIFWRYRQLLVLTDLAKFDWANDNSTTSNDIPTWDDLRSYLPDWASNVIRWTNGTPICPGGGTYTIGRIGEQPRCSIGGYTHAVSP